MFAENQPSRERTESGRSGGEGMSTRGRGEASPRPSVPLAQGGDSVTGLRTLGGWLPPWSNKNAHRARAHTQPAPRLPRHRDAASDGVLVAQLCSPAVIPASQTRRRAVRAQGHCVSTLRAGRPQTLEPKASGIVPHVASRGSDHRRFLAPRCRHSPLACKQACERD